MKDILLNENNEPVIVNGDFRTGESELQEVSIILQLRQGELKNDPVLGVNIQHYIKSKENRNAVERTIKIHLQRDGKNYDNVINKINFKNG
ncbi:MULTISPECIES: hypothetical protein [Chryseobacterium]|uniref:Uncharacterized protein n=1 Tax=Candidatus Chryseobacterium massiliense TaxID=204089 RepID=A0A3D9B3P6_9FLAO|nr:MULTISPECIES: hypothetical protein [Chryseobacterium]REC47876.1 hypothetical protein DRF68_12605 [Candidatus Chryseobacterium massiliae]